MEYPLGGIVGVGFGQAVGIFFFGDLGPVVEIKGNFDQGGIGHFDALVDLSYHFIVFG